MPSPRAARPALAALLLLPLAAAAPDEAPAPGEVLRVTLPRTHADAAPMAPVAFDIRLENLAEGRLHVRFELDDAPPTGWQVVPPQRLVLAGAGDASGRAKTAVLQVMTPSENGYVDETATLRLRAIASSESNPSHPLQEVPLQVLVNARGWHVPGPPLAPLLAAAAAILLARARGS